MHGAGKVNVGKMRFFSLLTENTRMKVKIQGNKN